MKLPPLIKGFAHLLVSSSIVAAADVVVTGAPITSGTVLIPSLTAGALAVAHAAFPSIIGWNPPTGPTPGGTK